MNIVDMIKEFQILGCKDISKCAVAARVYSEMRDVLKLEELESFYHPELGIVYFKGKRKDRDEIDTYLPISNCSEFDILELDGIRDTLHGEEFGKSLIAAICDPSSNILYYKMTQGFDFKK